MPKLTGRQVTFLAVAVVAAIAVLAVVAPDSIPILGDLAKDAFTAREG